MTPDEVLDGAADILDSDDYKWIQGDLHDGESGYCMAGAIIRAAKGDRNSIPARLYVNSRLPTGSISRWNDMDGRTQAEVVNELRELAKRYREENQI